MSSEELLPLVYQELHAMASAMLRAERAKGGVVGASGVGYGATLQPTVLVHEAYIRLLGPSAGDAKPGQSPGGVEPDWENRRHFFGAAAIAMRRILIDRARHLSGLAGKVRGDGGASVEDRSLPDFGRGGGGGIGEHEAVIDKPSDQGHPHEPWSGSAQSMLSLDAAMHALATFDPRRHEVVMLRFFAGLNIEQTARVLGVSPATVKSDWSFARAWLLRHIDKNSSQSTEG